MMRARSNGGHDQPLNPANTIFRHGRHVHRCALCGRPLTVKAADWRVSQPVNPDGTLGELRVEHSEAAGGCQRPA
jgi:hypothetical protein